METSTSWLQIKPPETNRWGHSNYVQLLYLSCIRHAKHKKLTLFFGSRFQYVIMCHNGASLVSRCCITPAYSIMLWNPRSKKEKRAPCRTHSTLIQAQSWEAASSFYTQTFLCKLSAQAALIITHNCPWERPHPHCSRTENAGRHSGAAVTLLPPIKKLWVWTCQLVANEDWVKERLNKISSAQE